MRSAARLRRWHTHRIRGLRGTIRRPPTRAERLQRALRSASGAEAARCMTELEYALLTMVVEGLHPAFCVVDDGAAADGAACDGHDLGHGISTRRRGVRFPQGARRMRRSVSRSRKAGYRGRVERWLYQQGEEFETLAIVPTKRGHFSYHTDDGMTISGNAPPLATAVALYRGHPVRERCRLHRYARPGVRLSAKERTSQKPFEGGSYWYCYSAR